MKSILIFPVAILLTFFASAQPKRAITFDDLISFGRVSDPQISSDGKTVAFVVTWQLKEENKSTSNYIWFM